MSDLELLKEAIGSSGKYSNNQCKVIYALLDISVNNIALANVKFLEEKTGVKASTIYFALKVFQKDGILRKDEQQGGFEFQEDKINFLLESYNKKSSL